MEDQIQFIAKYADWTAIKKMKITEQTDPVMIMEFLAGLGFTFDRKIEENLKKTVNLEEVDKVLNELIEGGKKADNIAKVIASVNGPKIGSIAKQLADSNPSWQKGEKKEIEEFIRTYAMRKALKELKVRVDYSHIEIPGMKKAMKKGK